MPRVVNKWRSVSERSLLASRMRSPRKSDRRSIATPIRDGRQSPVVGEELRLPTQPSKAKYDPRGAHHV